MNLLLFIFTLLVSFIAVRIGAIVFELTGLEWSLAKFQALSCFTGTGFTTKEAELITGNTQRRRIASVLIILGHAGFVTLIATFANSLRTDVLGSRLAVPFLHLLIAPQVLPWINLAIIILASFLFYRIFSISRFANKLTNVLRRRIIKQDIIKRVSFEELVVATGGYGISQIEICNDSPILNKTLIESGLRQADILVLAVERNEEIIPNPSTSTRFLLKDKLICFGKLGNIRKQVCIE